MVAIAIIVVRLRAIKNYIEAMPPVEDPLTGASNIYGSTVRNVDLAFQFHLDPLDVERVNQVLNAENIRERLRSTKKVKFTEYFRMLDEDGNSEWYAGTVISVPGVKLDSLLFTIEKTDANLNISFMQ